MKHLITIFLLTLSVNSFSQDGDKAFNCISYIDSLTQRKIYTSVDNMPELDGHAGLTANLITGIKFDFVPELSDTKGKIRFIVEVDGTISQITILDSINERIDKEIVDYIMNRKGWKCGSCKGIPVPVEVVIPYRFDF